jgi:methionyl-tRNA formyltransferase
VIRPLKIVFMGTPDFAVPPLQALHDSGHEVLAVVTQPDRPKGRGRKLTPPPVKQAPCHMATRSAARDGKRTDLFHRQMAELAPDLYVVVAFGQILPQSLLDIPAWRHQRSRIAAAPLPRCGAHPVGHHQRGPGNRCDHHDDGQGHGHRRYAADGKNPIGTDETAADLHDRLSEMGARTLSAPWKSCRTAACSAHPRTMPKRPMPPCLKKRTGRSTGPCRPNGSNA